MTFRADRADERLGQDELLASFGVEHGGVGQLLGIDGGELVAGQRPGRGGPDEEGSIGLFAFVVQERKADVHAGVIDLAVAETDFAGRERGAALRPPPDDFVALVEEAAVEEFLERPPDAFDVTLVVGHVGLVGVNPETEPFGQPFPFLHVPPDALLAELDKGLDAVGFDLLLGVNAEFLAHLDLDRQAVGIPAGFALAQVAPHGAVTGEEILDCPREAVAGVGHTVGGRRAFVEDEPLGIGPLLERFIVNLPLAPQLEDAGFLFGKADLRRDRIEHGIA